MTSYLIAFIKVDGEIFSDLTSILIAASQTRSIEVSIKAVNSAEPVQFDVTLTLGWK